MTNLENNSMHNKVTTFIYLRQIWPPIKQEFTTQVLKSLLTFPQMLKINQITERNLKEP
jgi:hypothetical protein